MRRTPLMTVAAISGVGVVVVVAGFVFPYPSRVAVPTSTSPAPPPSVSTTTATSSSSSQRHAVRRSIFFRHVRPPPTVRSALVDDEEGGALRLSSDLGTSTSSSTTSTPSEAAGRRRSWEESYALLVTYGEVHGHINVPQSDRPLGPWVNRQRIEHARYLHNEGMIRLRNSPGGGGGGGGGTTDNRGDGILLPRRSTSMTARRKELLDEVGFVWDAMGHSWNAHYAELCEFRKIHGHCVVPRSNGRLGAWVEKQRIEYKKYLRAVVAAATTARVGGGGAAAVGCDDDDGVAAVVEAAAEGEGGAPSKTILTEGRVRKLDDVGFVWDVRERQFERRLGQLRMHRQTNCGGESGGRPDPRSMNGSLALWVRRCERQYRKYLDAVGTGSADDETLSGILPENRRIALEGVGFCRSMFDEPRAKPARNRRATWEERYEELEEYKAEHGHCVVPKNYGTLGSWVRAQRHSMKEMGTMGSSFEYGGLLSRDRVDRLDRLGFVWDVHQWQWNQTYHELLRYKEDRNHTNVPMSYGGLGLWVFNQRSDYNSYRKGKQCGMTPARLELLGGAGFEFELGQKILSAADERWQMRMNELREYEGKWGTFHVRQSHNPSLYNWIQTQKAKLQGKKLKKEREDALRSIGFLDKSAQL